jgi:hypothetical protein
MAPAERQAKMARAMLERERAQQYAAAPRADRTAAAHQAAQLPGRGAPQPRSAPHAGALPRRFEPAQVPGLGAVPAPTVATPTSYVVPLPAPGDIQFVPGMVFGVEGGRVVSSSIPDAPAHWAAAGLPTGAAAAQPGAGLLQQPPRQQLPSHEQQQQQQQQQQQPKPGAGGLGVGTYEEERRRARDAQQRQYKVGRAAHAQGRAPPVGPFHGDGHRAQRSVLAVRAITARYLLS